ncbi:DegT/DnrJ/EryC1/StrS family aminotransferase [Paenibacillus sp. SYP-B3998]|uniref:DegT/DnrJ/EryC1/StrS family aminotransferase n=1 Tax=Paenibacillus sp. SYP-B3998 TaxID=2678564 RepID=A0A6G4A3W6_9BACL|nr:DegT/DnrJ/EryC1/StrS family aminotransferase [Paenibacillus sp. SYP-B3998]NEW08511.1 DegT/DnrJ/EryC1/StrS family aminotransferase [Paenibacillus sp. SYP-B3998]
MFIPLAKPDISEVEKQYVMEVLDSGQLSFGDKLVRFEQAFRQELSIPHAIAMNSGTSALHVAVKALGLQAGDEVITTSYSFIASSNCLLYENVKPVFIDIDPFTLNMDTRAIENAITPRTKAILAVHVFGQTCQMDDIMRIAKAHHLYVIEDACEALGAEWKGKKAGTFGDAAVFAFYANKQVTTGEGGILVTSQESIANTASSLRNQGRGTDNAWLEHVRIGYNYRMSDLQAAVGLAQMQRLAELMRLRELVAQRYKELIRAYNVPVTLPAVLEDCKISWFVFIVALPEGASQADTIRFLQDQGIQSKPYFPAIHLQPCYRDLLPYAPGSLPVTEQMSQRTIAIPFHPRLSPEEQEYVVSGLSQALQKG